MVVKRDRAARKSNRETGQANLQQLLKEIDELSKGPVGCSSLRAQTEMRELRQCRREISDLVALSE